MKRIIFRSLPLVVIVFILAGPLGASGTVETASVVPVPPVEVSYPNTISSIPLMEAVARSEGEFSGTIFTDHPQALAQLLAEEIDILATGFTLGISRFQARGDVLQYATPVWGVSALMMAEPIKSLADLAGKTLYLPFEGSPIDRHVKLSLETLGLADQVQLLYAPFPQGAALVLQGQADGVVLPEPLASKFETEGKLTRAINLADDWARMFGDGRSPQVSMFIRPADEETLQRYGRFYTLVNQAIIDMQADPSEYGARYADVFNLPQEVVTRAIENALVQLLSAGEEGNLISQYMEVMGLGELDFDFLARF